MFVITTRDYVYTYLIVNLNNFRLKNDRMFENVVNIAFAQSLKYGW